MVSQPQCVLSQTFTLYSPTSGTCSPSYLVIVTVDDFVYILTEIKKQVILLQLFLFLKVQTYR